MNKKLFIGLVLLMSLALLGIIGMQYFWFRNSIRVKQAELNLSVNEAMRNTALKLENRETLQKLLASLNKTDSTAGNNHDRILPKKTFSNTFEKNGDHRNHEINGHGNDPRKPHDPNDNNLQTLPPDEKYSTFSGINKKFSINIDSVAFAEEMRQQMYSYAEHLRHDRDDKMLQSKIDAEKDSIKRLNKGKAVPTAPAANLTKSTPDPGRRSVTLD